MGDTRHAYLIMAHNKPQQLKILLSLLDNENNDIFIHLDKRNGLEPRQFNNTKKSKTFFVESTKVTWGGIPLLMPHLY